MSPGAGEPAVAQPQARWVRPIVASGMAQGVTATDDPEEARPSKLCPGEEELTGDF